MQDIRYAIRMLLKNPGFSLTAIFTLALGIAANTTIFSVVDAVLLRPLPYPEPDRLFTLSWRTTQGTHPAALTPLAYQFWSENQTVFDAFAVTGDSSFNIVTSGGAQRVDGLQVTSAFFKSVGVQPFLGRGFVPEEDRPGGPPVIVLSYATWQQSYGGVSDIIGRQALLNDNQYTVVGIMPDGFSYPGSPQVYLPLTLIPDPKDRGSNYTPVGRLKQGVTIEVAGAETERLYRQFQAANPDVFPAEVNGMVVTPYQDLFNIDIRPLLNVLLAAVGAVLLIACANVANLLLSRTASRRKEVAIRVAAGAGSSRILRQLVTESLVLSSIAGAAGVLLARWSVQLLVKVNPELVARAAVVSVDLRVLIFSGFICLLTALIFGATGVFQARRFDTQKALKSETLGQSPEHRKLSSLFIVSEMVFATVLLVSASFLIVTFQRLQTIELGFNTKNLLAVELATSSNRYKSAAAVDRFEREIRERVRAIPGVLSVATASAVPLVRTYNHTATIGPNAETQDLYVEYRSVSTEYFETLGIRLVRGRTFLPTDIAGSAPVVLINETFARRFPVNSDPIGQRIAIAKNSPEEEAPREIIGIVADISDRPPGSPLAAVVYVPRSQSTDRIHQSANNFFPYSACLIRTADGININRQVREILSTIDPQVPVVHIRSIQEILSDSLKQERFNVFVMSIFAVVALLLTSVGLYGVVSYQVTQRTREIGVRVALGATRSEVLRVVMRRGINLLCAGIAIGLPAAFGFAQLIAGLLYGVTATNPWIYTGVSVLLMTVAVVATYIPARRAAGTNPMVALRSE
jgi:putative ABC transport system permease protein